MTLDDFGRLILVVSPNALERRDLQDILQRAGFQTLEAETGIQCLTKLLEQPPDLILIAREMPPLYAADFLRLVKRLTAAPVIVIGEGNGPFEIAALEMGADYYQQRPVQPQSLLARAKALMRRYPHSDFRPEDVANSAARDASLSVILPGRERRQPTGLNLWRTSKLTNASNILNSHTRPARLLKVADASSN